MGGEIARGLPIDPALANENSQFVFPGIAFPSFQYPEPTARDYGALLKLLAYPSADVPVGLATLEALDTITLDGDSSHAGSYTIRGRGYGSKIVGPAAGDLFLIGPVNGFNDVSSGVIIERLNLTGAGAGDSLLNVGSGYSVRSLLRQLELYGPCGEAVLVGLGGARIEDCLFPTPSAFTTAAIVIDNTTGGPNWIVRANLGFAQSSAGGVGVLIQDGTAGGYVIRDSNFTHLTTGLSVPGETTDLIVDGCEFDASTTAIYLNNKIHSSLITHSPFTGNTTNVAVGGSFYPDKLTIKDNPGLNPIGVVASPWQNTFPSGGSIWCGPFAPSGASTPTQNVGYRVEVTDASIDISGGTGVNVLIKDGSGGTVYNGAPGTPPLYLERGWTFLITWTTAPTIVYTAH